MTSAGRQGRLDQVCPCATGVLRNVLVQRFTSSAGCRRSGRRRGHPQVPKNEFGRLRFPDQVSNQFSTLRPAILENSPTLSVTSVNPSDRVWAAIK